MINIIIFQVLLFIDLKNILERPTYLTFDLRALKDHNDFYNKVYYQFHINHCLGIGSATAIYIQR